MTVSTQHAASSPEIVALAYHEGEFVALEDARVPVTTQALQYGTGVFEGIRAYMGSNGQVWMFRAHDHYLRFLRSCSMLRIDVGHSAAELCELTVELLRRSGADSDVYIRPLGYKRALMPGIPPGVRLQGVSDALSINAFRMGSYSERSGIRCAISSWRRPQTSVFPVRAKITGGYVNSALAADEARAGGYDDAILLNGDGNVSEASTSNVFAVIGGRLVTPPVTAGLLEGVTRDSVATLAVDLFGVPTSFEDLDRDDLLNADEVFLTGTGVEIVPVNEIAGRAVGTGAPGQLTLSLAAAYQEIVRGHNPDYHHWLRDAYSKTS